MDRQTSSEGNICLLIFRPKTYCPMTSLIIFDIIYRVLSNLPFVDHDGKGHRPRKGPSLVIQVKMQLAMKVTVAVEVHWAQHYQSLGLGGAVQSAEK